MPLLRNLRRLLNPNQRTFRSRITNNWKAKLICLLLAVFVWFWVQVRYVDSGDDWGLNEIRLSIPE